MKNIKKLNEFFGPGTEVGGEGNNSGEDNLHNIGDILNKFPKEHKDKFRNLLKNLQNYKGDVSKLIYDFGKKNDTIDSTLDKLDRYLNGDFDKSDDFNKSMKGNKYMIDGSRLKFEKVKEDGDFLVVNFSGNHQKLKTVSKYMLIPLKSTFASVKNARLNGASFSERVNMLLDNDADAKFDDSESADNLIKKLNKLGYRNLGISRKDGYYFITRRVYRN